MAPPGSLPSAAPGPENLPPTPSRRMRKDFAQSYLQDAPPEADPGTSSLPWSEAFRMAFQSIHLRMGRLSVVLVGIALAISFVTGLGYIQWMGEALRAQSTAAAGTGAGAMPPVEDNSLQLGWILIAVLIAAAGIANAILMSVTERIQEIGTLKCLGARNRHIVMLFLIETIFLGLLGGFCGALLGPLLALGLQFTLIGSEAAAALSWVNLAKLTGYGTGLSVVLTILAAVIPVRFAARVESAEAMRYHV